MHSTKYLIAAFVTFTCLQGTSYSCAQAVQKSGGYPARPISVITPTTGGASDVIARIVTADMARSMNGTFVVDARPGAGGNIATETVAHAPPDGYLLLQAVSSMLTINPVLYKKVRFDPMKDFEPISLLARAPYLLAVNRSLGVHNVRDLIERGRSQQPPLLYSSPGIGTPNHFLGLLFNSATGANMQHVPYRTTTGTTTDLLSGQVQVTFGSIPSLLPFARAGQIEVLGITSGLRSPLAPDIPSISETLPGFEFLIWYALLAPTKTPPTIVDTLRSAVVEALRSNQVREKMIAQGAEPSSSTPVQLTDMIRDELSKWSTVVKESGIVVD
jgi:tripartite-type tricarboxylate transporter receptor subunit TctC